MLFLSTFLAHTLPILFLFFCFSFLNFKLPFQVTSRAEIEGETGRKNRIPNIPKWIIRVECAVMDRTKSLQQPLIRMKEIPKRKRAGGERIKERWQGEGLLVAPTCDGCCLPASIQQLVSNPLGRDACPPNPPPNPTPPCLTTASSSSSVLQPKTSTRMLLQVLMDRIFTPESFCRWYCVRTLMKMP